MKKLAILFALLLTSGSALYILASCSNNSNPVNDGTVTDIDGNVYHTVTIGTQVWMVENLRTTKYNDGSSIPLVTEDTAWFKSKTPRYCWYNHDPDIYKNSYGALYNWYVVHTGKLAPIGWHVPTDAEWSKLTSYLGGEKIAGGKLKSTGTTKAGSGLWYSPNEGATNSSGFSALPAGECDCDGKFDYFGNYGAWWTSSEGNKNSAWLWSTNVDNSCAYSNCYNKCYGFSVRCLRNL